MKSTEKQQSLSQMEIDTITEVMNISMGSAATAASTLLDYKTTITTPVEKISTYDEFKIDNIESKVAIKIPFIEGVSGSLIILLAISDIRTIISLMDIETSDDFEIDEMAESAICELMNQMMGSSATVLSCFLGRTINISAPDELFIGGLDAYKSKYFNSDKDILSIDFAFNIAEHLESSLICLMETDLAKDIVDISLNFDNDYGFDIKESEQETENSKYGSSTHETENTIRFTREQLKAISMVYENYSSVLSFYLTSMLRSLVEVECVHIEEMRYSEFNNALPDSVVTGIGEVRFSDINENNNIIMMDISKPIVYEIIKNLLNKSDDDIDNEYGYEYDFSEVELTIIENMFRCMFPQMSDSWFNYLDFDAIYREIETNSRLMNVIDLDETIVIIMLDITINDLQGTMSVCIPAKILRKVESQCLRNVGRKNCADNLYRRSNVVRYLKESGLETK